MKNRTLVLFVLAVALFACHHKSDQTSSSPNKDETKPSYSAEVMDTSKAFVDKDAVDGLNIIKYKNGVIEAKGYCQSGKKYGEWQSFFEDGKLKSDEYFTLGLHDGKATVWYDNGQKCYEGQYKNGKLVGIWSYWDDKGKLLRTSNYDKKSQNIAL